MDHVDKRLVNAPLPNALTLHCSRRVAFCHVIFPQKGIFWARLHLTAGVRQGGGATVFMEHKLGFVYYGVASDGEKYCRPIQKGVF